MGSKLFKSAAVSVALLSVPAFAASLSREGTRYVIGRDAQFGTCVRTTVDPVWGNLGKETVDEDLCKDLPARSTDSVSYEVRRDPDNGFALGCFRIKFFGGARSVVKGPAVMCKLTF